METQGMPTEKYFTDNATIWSVQQGDFLHMTCEKTTKKCGVNSLEGILRGFINELSDISLFREGHHDSYYNNLIIALSDAYYPPPINGDFSIMPVVSQIEPFHLKFELKINIHTGEWSDLKIISQDKIDSQQDTSKGEITEIIGTHPDKGDWLRLSVSGKEIPDDIVAVTTLPVRVTATRTDGSTVNFIKDMTEEEFKNISLEGFDRVVE